MSLGRVGYGFGLRPARRSRAPAPRTRCGSEFIFRIRAGLDERDYGAARPASKCRSGAELGKGESHAPSPGRSSSTLRSIDRRFARDDVDVAARKEGLAHQIANMHELGGTCWSG